MGLNKENIKITILERDNYKYAIINIHISDVNNKIIEMKLIVPRTIVKSIEKKLLNYNKNEIKTAKSLIDLYKPLNIDEIEEAVKRLKDFL